MDGILRTLFDLDVLPDGGAPLRLAWERPLPAWGWALVILAAAALAAWSYRGLVGPRPARLGLAALRGALLVLAVALLAGPAAELPRERVEPDRLLVLVDRSRSIGIADVPADAPGAPRTSRDAQLRELLGRATSLGDPGEEREILWYGFHEGLFPLERPVVDPEAGPDAAPGLPVVLDAPDGDRTRLDRALQQAVARSAGRPVSGVLLFSDGRTTEGDVDPARLRALREEAIGVFTVPLGSSEPLGDLSVRSVDAPARAFVEDRVPVRVRLDRLGTGVDRLSATVRLVDEATGEVLDEVALPAGSTEEEVLLEASRELAGESTWAVEVVSDEPDLVPENDRSRFAIELVDRPMRVLFVEGYPRWEYRYLKNLMVREKSIESSVMLLSADRDFAQEGNQPITRLPRTAEEFERFDVIVLGDVPAGFFSQAQLELMRNHVAERGAGLLWIAGERNSPASFADTVLADLLPMRGTLDLPTIDGAVTMEPTPLARRLGVLQVVAGGEIGWPESLRSLATGWSRLWWALRLEPARLKPTAEVLASTVQRFDGTALPLVVNLRYGAGQSIFVATDEIWRWRYGRGELLPDQFWIQMIRMLGRESLAGSGLSARLVADPRRVEVGRTVQVRAQLLDASLVDDRRTTLEAEVVDADGVVRGRLVLRREGEGADRFATAWLPETPGEYLVRVRDPSLALDDAVATIEAFAPADELRSPEADHPLLRRIAQETGGAVLAPGDLATLDERLPRRAIRTDDPLRESIWDTPLVFTLLLGLLTLEWVGRKILRMA